MFDDFQPNLNHIALGILLIVLGGYTTFHYTQTVFSNFENNLKQASKQQVAQAEVQVKVSPEPTPAPSLTPIPVVQVMFGGDLMYDRHIRQNCEQEGYDYPLSSLEPLLNQHDLVVANLEGPVTDNDSVSVNTIPGSTNNFIFTFDTQVLPALKQANVKLVNLGNNHILNFGVDGYEQTLLNLQEQEIDYYGQIGSSVTDEMESLSHVYEENGVKIGFVNFNQFSDSSIEPVVSEVSRLKDLVDWVVVTPHWGSEYVYNPNSTIKSWAKQLVAAGADLIVGAHPHVVQAHETHLGKHIYYSLGNFVFDQYFQPEVRSGLLLGVTFSKDDLAFKEYPIELKESGQTVLIKQEAATDSNDCGCGR